MSEHPSRGTIDQFFAQSLTAQQEESLLDHITTCAWCQDSYPEVLDGLPALSSAEDAPPVSPDCRRLMERIKNAGPPDLPAAHLDVHAPPPALAGYEIEAVIGRGGMGVVYRARHLALKRTVALKMILAGGHAGERERRRFRVEAEAVARLQHPNIVQVFEVGENNGLPYCALEYVAGGSLAQRLFRGSLPLNEAVGLVETLARAMQLAHSRNIVHRDLKPANVLLSAACGLAGPCPDHTAKPQAAELPKIADFGLAKYLDSETDQTATGAILGTPSYMAPEQARGDTREVGPAADVYALGAIFYELLTGRPPFKGPTRMDTVEQVLHNEPVPPARLKPHVPRDLETICLKCLAKEPEKRYASAEALAGDLQRWQSGKPIEARPVGRAERVLKWVKREPMTAAFLGLMAAFLLAVSVGVPALVVLRNNARNIEELQRVQEAVHAEREWLFALDQAQQRLRRPTPGLQEETEQTLLDLKKYRDKVKGPAIRDALDLQTRSIYALSLAVPNLHVTEQSPEFPAHFAWTWPSRLCPNPDGNVIAIGTSDRPLFWEHGKPLVLPSLDPDRPRGRVSYSADGKYLAFAPAQGGLEIWDGRRQQRVVTLADREQDPRKRVLAIHFDSESAVLHACQADGAVRSWSLQDWYAHSPTRIKAAGYPLSAAAFSTDGTLLVVADADKRILRCNAAGTEEKVLHQAKTAVQSLAISGDNRLLAVGTLDGLVTLLDVEGMPLRQWDYSTIGVYNLFFHPNGRALVASARSGGTMWDVYTGEELLTDLPASPTSCSPDGSRLAASDRKQVLFAELKWPTVLRPLTGHRVRVEHLAWSTNSRHLVSIDNRYEVRVFDVASGAIVAAFANPPGQEYAGNHQARSDGGRYIASAGGRDAFLYEIGRPTPRDHWHFDTGALGNQLAHVGNGKFRLVREMDDDGSSVVYELERGQPAKRLRTLRSPGPGERDFLHGRLTPDGRLYVWVGPRKPKANYRAEFYEVASGTKIKTVKLHTRPDGGEPGATIFSGGRYMMINDGAVPLKTLYDLTRLEAPPLALPDELDTISPDLRWFSATARRESARTSVVVALRSWPDGAPWLEINNLDGSLPAFHSFSPDGRYGVWLSPTGRITVADLPELRRRVAEFRTKFEGE